MWSCLLALGHFQQFGDVLRSDEVHLRLDIAHAKGDPFGMLRKVTGIIGA